jgi:hypothetical protein
VLVVSASRDYSGNVNGKIIKLRLLEFGHVHFVGSYRLLVGGLQRQPCCASQDRRQPRQRQQANQADKRNNR